MDQSPIVSLARTRQNSWHARPRCAPSAGRASYGLAIGERCLDHEDPTEAQPPHDGQRRRRSRTTPIVGISGAWTAPARVARRLLAEMTVTMKIRSRRRAWIGAVTVIAALLVIATGLCLFDTDGDDHDGLGVDLCLSVVTAAVGALLTVYLREVGRSSPRLRWTATPVAVSILDPPPRITRSF
jgi:hypothetical protein